MRQIQTALALIVLMPALSGCILFAAGAGGATGYYLSKDDRPSPQVEEDDAITARVRNQLALDRQIDAMHLEVESYYGVVTLRGDISNAALAERAMTIARNTRGVKGVRSEITLH